MNSVWMRRGKRERERAKRLKREVYGDDLSSGGRKEQQTVRGVVWYTLRSWSWDIQIQTWPSWQYTRYTCGWNAESSCPRHRREERTLYLETRQHERDVEPLDVQQTWREHPPRHHHRSPSFVYASNCFGVGKDTSRMRPSSAAVAETMISSDE